MHGIKRLLVNCDTQTRQYLNLNFNWTDIFYSPRSVSRDLQLRVFCLWQTNFGSYESTGSPIRDYIVATF